MLKLQFVIAEF